MRKLVCLLISLLLVLSISTVAAAADPDLGGSDQPSEEVTCPHEWTTTTIPATCTEAGSKTTSCAKCGQSTTETLPAAGHSWQDSADTPHKRSCTVCGAEETGSHNWGEGVVTVQPTCTAGGQKTYTCDCGATKTEDMAAAGHTYSEWTGDAETHSRSCTVCGKTESGSHSLDKGTIIAEATCAEEGGKLYVCSVCGGGVLEMLPKVAHTYDNACDPDCNVCKAVREVEHRFSKAWSKNSMGHWHVCAICGEKKDEADHYPGPAATEEKEQICMTCGYVLTQKLNHTHDYETKLTSDETGHWYACAGCEDQKDFEAHVYDDLCDPDCNLCGYVAATAHSFDDSWESDESSHWSVCVLCGEKSEAEAHVPDPKVSDTEAQVCTVCGYEIAPAKEHVHEFAQSWAGDDVSHWKECECGEKADEAAHSWDKGTKNEDSSVTYVCEECGAERTEIKQKTQRSLLWEIILVVLIIAFVGILAALILVLRYSRKSGAFSQKKDKS